MSSSYLLLPPHCLPFAPYASLATGPPPSDHSYYVIIVSIWTTQLHYDIRYEGDDATHRLLKPLHLVLFVYIGAASGGWDLSKIVRPEYLDLDAGEAVNHGKAFGFSSGRRGAIGWRIAGDSGDARQEESWRRKGLTQDLAADSFLTVAIASAVHRALLTAQYVMGACPLSLTLSLSLLTPPSPRSPLTTVIILGSHASRPTSSARLSAAFMTLACVLALCAAAIPSRDSGLAGTRIAFLYAGVLVDFSAILVQVVWGMQVPLRWHRVAERYGSLTLIILYAQRRSRVGADH